MKLAREDIGLSSLLSSLVEHLRLIKLYLADLQALEEAAGAVTSNSVVAALSSGILVQQLKALAAPSGALRAALEDWAEGRREAMAPDLEYILLQSDPACIDDTVGEPPHKDLAREFTRSISMLVVRWLVWAQIWSSREPP